MIDYKTFNREMDIFDSFIRRSTTDEAELILLGLCAKLQQLTQGSNEYEMCTSKIFFTQKHIEKRKRNPIKRKEKPWNLG